MIPKRTSMVSTSLIALITMTLCMRYGWNNLTEWISDHTLPLLQSTEQAPPPDTEDDVEKIVIPEPDIVEAESTPQAIENKESDQTLEEPSITPDKDFECRPLKQDPTKKARTARRRKKIEAESENLHKEEAPKKQSQKSAEPVSIPTSVSSKSEKTEDSSTVRVCNKIDINKLTVKHWTGKYSPTKLEITLNDVPFVLVGKDVTEMGDIKDVPCPDNQITVHYSYEFLNGMRKGSDTLTYEINDLNAQINLRFSWDTEWHVELDGAQRIE